MTDETPEKREERLARARSFLAAGKTQIASAPLVPPADPAPSAASETETEAVADGDNAPKPDPTRFGDWEKNGRCIDF